MSFYRVIRFFAGNHTENLQKSFARVMGGAGINHGILGIHGRGISGFLRVFLRVLRVLRGCKVFILRYLRWEPRLTTEDTGTQSEGTTEYTEYTEGEDVPFLLFSSVCSVCSVVQPSSSCGLPACGGMVDLTTEGTKITEGEPRNTGIHGYTKYTKGAEIV
jgi:hypothetical protein